MCDKCLMTDAKTPFIMTSTPMSHKNMFGHLLEKDIQWTVPKEHKPPIKLTIKLKWHEMPLFSKYLCYMKPKCGQSILMMDPSGQRRRGVCAVCLTVYTEHGVPMDPLVRLAGMHRLREKGFPIPPRWRNSVLSPESVVP